MARTTARVRYAVVGAGHIAQAAVLPAFRNARRNSELAAIVSGDPVKRDALAKNGVAWSTEEEAAYKAPILEQYDAHSSAYYASARLWDDGIIDPKATRATLASGLAIAAQAPAEKTAFGVFRM